MSRRKRTRTEDLLSIGGQELPFNILQGTTTAPDGTIQSYTGLHMTKNQPKQVPKKEPKITVARKSFNINLVYGKLETSTTKCCYCKATMWIEERPKDAPKDKIYSSFCCQEGKVLLPKLHQPPQPLKALLEDDTIAAKNFRKKIILYNSLFSFTSFGAKIDETINHSKGPYAFRISGQNYHRFGSLILEEDTNPKFAQLYFYDTSNEVENRMGCMKLEEKDVDRLLIESLLTMLDSSSAVAKAFRMARDWAQSNEGHEFKIRLIGQRKQDTRQYNLPMVSEIAALIIGDLGESQSPRDVYVQRKTGKAERISELHPLYMALQYPLLFPHGEDGYHDIIPYTNNTGKRQTKRGYITMKEFYAYRVQQRLEEATTLILGGHLFHQYLVDAFTAMEEQRLRWIKFNQNELRADLYNNICDDVAKGDTDAQTIGKRIVMPSSFTGGPRYMIQNYQDAMGLCRTFGNPSLFITFTANPRWLEMTEILSQIPNQTANDRPDLMSHLFRMKLAQIMHDIRENEIFGPTDAAVYTIEFQKRGLPHAHILLWLKDGNKAVTSADIDDVISAEFPDPTSDPEAHKAVLQHMVHGPCGDENKKAPCMSDGNCTKHYPKPFYADTTVDEDGFPIYKCRNNGLSVVKGKAMFGNRHVVPYNRYLLLKYDAHINVEWCNRSRAIKYLFKYICKGPDKATLVFQNMHNSDGNGKGVSPVIDEILQYLECRYLSACEAAWRIFGFDIHHSRPAVIRMTFHLPDQQPVTLKDDQNLTSLLQKAQIGQTMFTEWFTLNKIDSAARQYTYAEIPTKYVWHSQDKSWTIRKQQEPIGRIVYSHPASGERYYLRMLLNVVKGPRSFEEIRTVNGKIYNSFRETCYALGMLNDDKEWTGAIQEANQWATGVQLRELFVTILLFCDVSQPKSLWENNWEALSQDILYQKRKQYGFPNMEISASQIQNYCLLNLQEILIQNGKSLADYPEMSLPDRWLLTSLDNRLEEKSYNVAEMSELHEQMHQQLNCQQLDVYSKVIKAVQNKTGEFFFVYGAGGTGKTFLYKTIMARLKSEKKIVLAVASSGIATLLLQGGRTAHSRFVIPLELLENSTRGITQNSHLAQLLHEVELIIWDEAPMTQRYAFEALNRTLQDILGLKDNRNQTKLFRGISVLLGGDFRQILSVITKGRRQEIVQACINNSPLWQNCIVLKLTQSMRVNPHQENGSINKCKQDFNEWILQVGEGQAPAIALEDEDENTWIDIPEDFLIQPGKEPIRQLIDEVYKNFKTKQGDTKYLQERAILTPLNDDADQINKVMFGTLEGKMKVYRSSDEVCLASTDTADQEHMYPTEFLNTLNFPGMPPHMLELKEGLPVILLRNVNPTQGLCNGTRLIITYLGDWVIEGQIITGAYVGNKVLIPRITLSSTKTKWPFVMKRRQFPIKPCFAMTINKSQGQSLKHVGLFLPKPVFSHGQLYVVISRVTDPAGLKILMINRDKDPKNRTKNIVFKEAFKNLTPQLKDEHQQQTELMQS